MVFVILLQEVLTEVACGRTESINENDVLLPENCLKETFTIMVEDNIDWLEETLSGEYYIAIFIINHISNEYMRFKIMKY